MESDRTFVVMIDMQERLAPRIEGIKEIVDNSKKLLKASKIFGIPIIATEQIKLGETIPELRIFPDFTIKKTHFSCMREKSFLEVVENIGKEKCIFLGIETHICILQTAMDMIEDFEVYVAVDCTGSRRRFDKEVALQRMSSKGVVLTTAETAIYELLESAENEKFREILSIVKGE